MSSETKLTIDIFTEGTHLSKSESLAEQIRQAAIYADSLFNLLRLARNLDDIALERDAQRYTEAINHACQIGSAIQELIYKKIGELEEMNNRSN